MKSFSRRGYQISDANSNTKLIYTFFLIFTLLGFLTIAVYQLEIIGWGLESIRDHYLGNAVALQFPKSFLQLLEVSHAHAFIMGVVYLTLAHILIATRLSERTKYTLIVGGFIATLLDLILPWAIRYGFGSGAYVLMLAWIGEWVFYLSYIVIPIYDMWIKAPHSENV